MDDISDCFLQIFFFHKYLSFLRSETVWLAFAPGVVLFFICIKQSLDLQRSQLRR